MENAFKVGDLVEIALEFGARIGNFLKRRGWGRWIAGRIAIDLLLWPRDFLKSRNRYRQIFGQAPKLLSPATFNEKMQRNKLLYRRSIHTVFADKIAVRDFVKDRAGPDVLTKVYWTGTDVRKVPKDILPRKFVIKANHASGTNILVEDRDSFDWNRAHETTQWWLKMDYASLGGEWQYRWISPALFIEEFLEAPDGQPPPDFKCFCFRGRVHMVQIDVARFLDHSRVFVNRDFEVLDFELHYPLYRGALVKPINFGRMIELAETLGTGQPFLRVDLYDLGKPIFGELTLHPGAGFEKFSPAQYDLEFGKLLP